MLFTKGVIRHLWLRFFKFSAVSSFDLILSFFVSSLYFVFLNIHIRFGILIIFAVYNSNSGSNSNSLVHVKSCLYSFFLLLSFTEKGKRRQRRFATYSQTVYIRMNPNEYLFHIWTNEPNNCNNNKKLSTESIQKFTMRYFFCEKLYISVLKRGRWNKCNRLENCDPTKPVDILLLYYFLSTIRFIVIIFLSCSTSKLIENWEKSRNHLARSC